MAKPSQFKDNIWLFYSFTVLLLRTLIREFARVSQAIIDSALKRKNSPTPELNIIFRCNEGSTVERVAC